VRLKNLSRTLKVRTLTPGNELNDLIAYYKTQLKARATRRKAGKDVSKETPITPAAA